MCLIKTKCGNMNSPAQNIILILLNNEHLAIVRIDLKQKRILFYSIEFINKDKLDFISSWFYNYGQNYINESWKEQFVVY